VARRNTGSTGQLELTARDRHCGEPINSVDDERATTYVPLRIAAAAFAIPSHDVKEPFMAKHDIDPVLQELVRSINESGQAAVPVTVSAHGTVLTGTLIAQDRYFVELIEGNALMSALEPTSGLLGKEYAKEVDAESGYYVHMRAAHVAGSGGGSGRPCCAAWWPAPPRAGSASWSWTCCRATGRCWP